MMSIGEEYVEPNATKRFRGADGGWARSMSSNSGGVGGGVSRFHVRAPSWAPSAVPLTMSEAVQNDAAVYTRINAAGEGGYSEAMTPYRPDYTSGNATHNTSFSDPGGMAMQSLVSMLGKPTRPVQQDPYSQYSVESHDLPFAFLGHRKETTQLVLNMVALSEQWPIRFLLPVTKMDSTDGGVIRQIIFDEHMLSRVAFQTPARTVTNRTAERRYGTAMYSLGQTLERGFWLTPKGRFYWACGTTQIARATIETLCYLAVGEVLSARRFFEVIEEEIGTLFNGRTWQDILQKSIQDWGVIQLKEHGVDLAADHATQIFRARNVYGAPTMTLPDGAARHVAMSPERTDYQRTGVPLTNGKPWGDYNSDIKVNGMARAFTGRAFRTGEKKAPIDLQYRNVSIGGSCFIPGDIPTAFQYDENGKCMYRTAHAAVMRYFDHTRSIERIGIKDAWRATLLYDDEGHLTMAGAFYFHGHATYVTKSKATDLSTEFLSGATVDGKQTAATIAKHRVADDLAYSKRFDAWSSAIRQAAANGIDTPFVGRVTNGATSREHNPHGFPVDGKMNVDLHLHNVGSFYLSTDGGINRFDALVKAIASRDDFVIRKLETMATMRPERGGPVILPAGGGGGGPKAGGAAGLGTTSMVASVAKAAEEDGDGEANAMKRATNALYDRVKNALMRVPLLDNKYWNWAFQYDIPLLIGVKIAIPEMTYQGGTAIVFMDGLGRTEVGFGDYTIGLNPLTRMYNANFRVNAASLVVDEKKLVLLPNVFIRQYVGGNANVFFEARHVAPYRMRECNGNESMFAFACHPGTDETCGQRGYFDISGRFNDQLVSFADQRASSGGIPQGYHWSTAPLYQAIWRFRANHAKVGLGYHEAPFDAMNSICFQEFQRTADHKGEFYDYIRGRGHWGPFAETGDHDVRVGQYVGPKQYPYRMNPVWRERHLA